MKEYQCQEAQQSSDLDRMQGAGQKLTYECCMLCPRMCYVNREKQAGYCGCGVKPRVARAALHFWEEPCISGERGSGAVFFGGCNLRCVFCQNREISAGCAGMEIETEQLAKIFLRLQKEGAHNLNLVTPGHYALSVADALRKAKENGMNMPVVYNCGGYERVETLQMFRGLVDIYLPDFKFVTSSLAKRYCEAADYPQRADEALAEMYEQTGDTVLSEDGMMKRGVIVRHLVLPGHTKEAKEVLHRLFEKYGNRIYYSILSQYTPLAHVKTALPELGRTLTGREYQKVVDYALALGVENGYIQEGKAAKESFIPAFDNTGLDYID